MAIDAEVLRRFMRGNQFEKLEKSEWAIGDFKKSESEHSLCVGPDKTKRGRIDVLIKEHDGSVSIIEIKSTDWSGMASHRVRLNALRHIRQVMKYVYPIWEKGVDVVPGLIYPKAPCSPERREQVETILEEHLIQVVWANERVSD
ncbi:MAG: hypothetical protein QF898_12445 [SAR202 cluster bacterium]|jgi:hypothetical protein|nr:hypothetical protein [SAR202 cluster bacterium]MDP6714955.1 hypothetical protein [SAR202 cluster bacterium]